MSDFSYIILRAPIVTLRTVLENDSLLPLSRKHVAEIMIQVLEGVHGECNHITLRTSPTNFGI